MFIQQNYCHNMDQSTFKLHSTCKTECVKPLEYVYTFFPKFYDQCLMRTMAKRNKSVIFCAVPKPAMLKNKSVVVLPTPNPLFNFTAYFRDKNVQSSSPLCCVIRK